MAYKMIDHSALVKYAGKSLAIERNRLKGAQLRGGETEQIEHDLACAKRIYDKLARQNVSAVKLAGILSNDRHFWVFLQVIHKKPCTCEDDAADFIRWYCNIVSRKDLRSNERAQTALKTLNQSFKDFRKYQEC